MESKGNTVGAYNHVTGKGTVGRVNKLYRKVRCLSLTSRSGIKVMRLRVRSGLIIASVEIEVVQKIDCVTVTNLLFLGIVYSQGTSYHHTPKSKRLNASSSPTSPHARIPSANPKT